MQVQFLCGEHVRTLNYSFGDLVAIPRISERIEISGWPEGQEQRRYKVKCVTHFYTTRPEQEIIVVELENSSYAKDHMETRGH